MSLPSGCALSRNLLGTSGRLRHRRGIIGRVQSWQCLTVAEQTLVRRALSGAWLAGTVQIYGMALRWAGVQNVPPRSYTDEEQRRLVPHLADVAVDLAARGLLAVARCADGGRVREPLALGGPLQQIVTDPANWIWNPSSASAYQLSAPQHVHEHWFADAYPTADTAGLPAWEQLSRAEREVLVCAGEASGMLTGAFGIWPDPPADLTPAERHVWIERQVTPLLPFVRAGWIEVRHYPTSGSDAYAVIPADALSQALADPALREGQDWGVGVGCVFTYHGLAIWRSEWSSAWNSRLTFD